MEKEEKAAAGRPQPCPAPALCQGHSSTEGQCRTGAAQHSLTAEKALGSTGGGRAGGDHSGTLILRMSVQGGTQAQHFAPGFYPLENQLPGGAPCNAPRRSR